MINKVEILGRLGADPEVKVLENGTTLARVSVGTNKSWTDKNGVKQEETSWHSITMFGKLAENAQKILQKGSLVYVEGELKYRTVEDGGDKKRYTDINAKDFRILADGKRNQNPNEQMQQPAQQQMQQPAQQQMQQPAQQQMQQPAQQQMQQPAQQQSFVTGTDDDLPF
jgi:single-strand DNA-binding protein